MARPKHDIIKSLIVGFAVVELCLTWGMAAHWAEVAAELAKTGDSLNYVSPLRVWGLHLLLFLVAAVLLKFSKPWALVSAACIGCWLILVTCFDIFEFLRFFLVMKDELQIGWLAYRRWFWFDPGGIQVFPRFAAVIFIVPNAIRGLKVEKRDERLADPA